MSEYQFYEFLAVDRPLNDRQQAEVQPDDEALLRRAPVSGELGTQRIMLRLPCGLLDIDVAGDYCVGDQLTAWTAGEYLVLDLNSEDEAGDFDPDAVAPAGRAASPFGRRHAPSNARNA